MASSQLPTAQPRSILRGHKAQVHATAFVRADERLASGDADGYVVLWDLTIVRPRAVWQAHTNAILGIAAWGTDKLITWVYPFIEAACIADSISGMVATIVWWSGRSARRMKLE